MRSAAETCGDLVEDIRVKQPASGVLPVGRFGGDIRGRFRAGQGRRCMVQFSEHVLQLGVDLAETRPGDGLR